MVGACARRSQVSYAHARGISLRRACGLLSVARSALRYQSRLAVKDAPVLTHRRIQ
jgi:putative transposase